MGDFHRPHITLIIIHKTDFVKYERTINMKKYLICLGGSHIRKSFEFPCIECAIRYVIDNPFEFVTFRLLDSKQVFIYEMRDDNEYYLVAFFDNVILENYSLC